MMSELWTWIKAVLRIDLKAVCEASKGRPLESDFHCWLDTDTADTLEPINHCRRCGKSFIC